MMMSVAAGGGSIAAGSAEIGHTTRAPQQLEISNHTPPEHHHHTPPEQLEISNYTEGATIMMTIMKQLE